MKRNPVRRRRKIPVTRLAPLAGTLLIFYLIFRKVDIGRTLDIMKDTDHFYLFSAVFVSLLANIFIGSARWAGCLHPSGCHLTLKRAMFVKLGAHPYKVFLPFKIGEVARAAYLNRHEGVPIEIAIGSVIYDKLLNLLATVAILVAAGTFVPALSKPIWFLALPLLLFLPSVRRLILKGSHRLPPAIEGVAKSTFYVFDNIKLELLFFLFFLSVVFVLLSPVLTSWLILRGMGIETVPFATICVFVLLIDLASSLPISLAGLGTREASYILLFASFAQPSKLLAVGLAASFVEQLFPAFLGLSLTPAFMKGLLKPGEKQHVENSTTPLEAPEQMERRP